MTYVGIELGNYVSIGDTILTKPETDPIRAAYNLFYKIYDVSDRPAWAGLALLFAARGLVQPTCLCLLRSQVRRQSQMMVRTVGK